MAKRKFGDAFGLNDRSYDHVCFKGSSAPVNAVCDVEAASGFNYNDTEKDAASETNRTCDEPERSNEATTVVEGVMLRRIVLVPYADSPMSNVEPDLSDCSSPFSDDGDDCSSDVKSSSVDNIEQMKVFCKPHNDQLTISHIGTVTDVSTKAIIEPVSAECEVAVTCTLEGIDSKAVPPVGCYDFSITNVDIVEQQLDESAVIATANDQLYVNCEQPTTPTLNHVENGPVGISLDSDNASTDNQRQAIPLVVLNGVSCAVNAAENRELVDSATNTFASLTATELVSECFKAAVQIIDCNSCVAPDAHCVAVNEMPAVDSAVVSSLMVQQKEKHRDCNPSDVSTCNDSVASASFTTDEANNARPGLNTTLVTTNPEATRKEAETGDITDDNNGDAGDCCSGTNDFILNECSGEFVRVALPDISVNSLRNNELISVKEADVDVHAASDAYTEVTDKKDLEIACAKEMTTFCESTNRDIASTSDTFSVKFVSVSVDTGNTLEQRQFLLDTVVTAAAVESVQSTCLTTESIVEAESDVVAIAVANAPCNNDAVESNSDTCMKDEVSKFQRESSLNADMMIKTTNDVVPTAELDEFRPLSVVGFDETSNPAEQKEALMRSDAAVAIEERITDSKATEDKPLELSDVGNVKPDVDVSLDSEASICNEAIKEQILSGSQLEDDSPVYNKRKLEDEEEHEFTQIKKKGKKSVNFDGVTVYYFPRAQGFCCVPSQGGSTLGMAESHSSVERFSVGSFARMRKLHHRHKLWQRERDKQRILQQLSYGSLSPTKLSLTDLDAEDLDSSFELDDVYFLQPLNTRERRRMLKIAGVNKIDMTEMLECNGIRSSREVCGCSCRVVCDPKTCLCSLAGIECQVDRLSFPCGCTQEGCRNPNGRIEFNPLRVRMHLVHTLMRLKLQQKRESTLRVNGGGTGKQCVQRQMLMDEMPTDESSGGEDEEEDCVLSEGELCANDIDNDDLQSATTGKFNSNERGSCNYCQKRNTDTLSANAQFYGNNGHVVRRSAAYSDPDDVTRNGEKVAACSPHSLTKLTTYSYDNDDVFVASEDSADECYLPTNLEPKRRYEACAYTQTPLNNTANGFRTTASSASTYVPDHSNGIYDRVSHAESISGMLSPLRFMQTSYQSSGSNGFVATSSQQFTSANRTNCALTNAQYHASDGYTSVPHHESTTVYGSFAHIYGDHAGYVVRDDHADYIAKYSEIDIGYHSYATAYSVYDDVSQTSSASLSASSVNSGNLNAASRSFQYVNASMQNGGTPYSMYAANTTSAVAAVGGKCASQYSQPEKYGLQVGYNRVTMLRPSKITDAKSANGNVTCFKVHATQDSGAGAKFATLPLMSVVCPRSNDVVRYTVDSFKSSLPSVSAYDAVNSITGDACHGLTVTPAKEYVLQHQPSDSLAANILTADVCPAFEQVKVDTCIESVSV